MRTPEIMIGPLIGEYGGATQHILNLIKFSKYYLNPILPNSLSLYYSESTIKRHARSILKKLKLSNFDLYGLMVSKVFFPHCKIIHLHGHPHWPEIYLKSKSGKVHYIHTVHQVYFREDCYSDEEWKMKNYLNQLMFESCKKSDVVISVAKWQQKILQEKGIESIYIPNGIDDSDCETADPARFQEKFHIYEDFYLFPGDIRHSKRPELFLALAKMIPEEKFIMIGYGITKDNLSKQLGQDIPDNVICLGQVSHHDALDIFAASKVFVLPSKNETFSISLIEAMGCKSTVVAANYAGPKEMIEDGIDGFLFKPDNVESLYEKAVLAWDHPEIGVTACQKIKEKYRWNTVITKIDDLYTQLLYTE